MKRATRAKAGRASGKRGRKAQQWVKAIAALASSDSGALASSDGGALAYLRSRGYSAARIAELIAERNQAGRLIGLSRIVHPIERAAVHVLSGPPTPAWLWLYAQKHHDVAEKQAAKEATKPDRARLRNLRERIAALADLYHHLEPELNRGMIIDRIQSRTFPEKAIRAFIDEATKGALDAGDMDKAPEDEDVAGRIERIKSEASKVATDAVKRDARTVSEWLRKDCDDIPAPIGKPRKKKVADP